MAALTCPTTLTSLEKISRFLHKQGAQLKISADRLTEADLIVEELCVNIINYAYPAGEAGQIEIRSSAHGKDWMIEIRDSGRPFDITAAKDPELDQPVHKRERIKIGGLGIYLSKHLAKKLQYRREDGQNITTITI